jgi:hypothetical protein
MKTLSPFASRTRAGMLVLALALVGGIGCAAVESATRAEHKYLAQQQNAARRQRIAELTSRAGSGDPAAMTQLAQDLLTENATNVPRAIDLLNRSAASGYPRAQALLGDALVNGRFAWNTLAKVPPEMSDTERGFALLRQAATHACWYQIEDAAVLYTYNIQPSHELSDEMLIFKHGPVEEGALWRARSILYCRDDDNSDLADLATSPQYTLEQRRLALAVLLLGPTTRGVAKAKAALTPVQLADAERDARELRRRVAEFEKTYPVPKDRKSP